MLRRRGHCFCFSKGLCRGSVCTFALNHFKVSNRDNINLKCYLAACHLCDTWGGPHTCCRRVVGLPACRPAGCVFHYVPSCRLHQEIRRQTICAIHKCSHTGCLQQSREERHALDLWTTACRHLCQTMQIEDFFFFFSGGKENLSRPDISP